MYGGRSAAESKAISRNTVVNITKNAQESLAQTLFSFPGKNSYKCMFITLMKINLQY